MSIIDDITRSIRLLHFWREAMLEIYHVNPEMAKAAVVAAIARIRKAVEEDPSKNAIVLDAVKEFISDAKENMP